jgi:hypothetical protein
MDSVGTSPCPAPWAPPGRRHAATGHDYAILVHPYPTTKSAREAAGKLVDDIAEAVVSPTFVAHMAADLSDEDMEVLPHHSRFGNIRHYFQPLGHSLRGSCCPTGLIPPRRTPIGETC